MRISFFEKVSYFVKFCTLVFYIRTRHRSECDIENSFVFFNRIWNFLKQFHHSLKFISLQLFQLAKLAQLYIKRWIIFLRIYKSRKFNNVDKVLPQPMFWIWNKPKFDTFLAYVLSKILVIRLGKSENKRN